MTPEEFQRMTRLIVPLGFHKRRAKGIVRFTKDYVALIHQKKKKKEKEKKEHQQLSSYNTTKDDDDDSPKTRNSVEFHLTRQEILRLFHCGAYCADAYQIFVRRDWATLSPSDHALKAFVEWQQSQSMR
jgi:hypothetical protein